MTAVLGQGQALAAELIAKLIKEYAEGISDREEEAVAFAGRCGLDVKEVREGFANAREVRDAEGGLFISPALQPARQYEEVSQPEAANALGTAEGLGDFRAKARARLAAFGAKAKQLETSGIDERAEADDLAGRLDAAIAEKAQPQEAQRPAMLAAVVPQPTPGFFIAPAVSEAPAEDVLVLDPAAPFDNAQKIVSLRAWHKADGVPTMRYWQKSFWDWTGTHWREVEDDTARAAMWQQLNAAEKYVKGGKRARFEPKLSDVNATLDALRGAVNLSKDEPMPGWFGTGRPEGDLRELVACENGLLHIPSRALLPHSPKFWSANALPYRYEPQATAPRFAQFLDEIFPGDTQAQQSLLEMFGYCLTDLTKYQKAFMFVGPPRGGRGTIGRVLRGLIGPENYVGTSLKAFSEPFGMENFVGKKVAVFSDARLDGVPQRNLTIIAERLLRITGEDEVEVNRKNSKYWNGQLTTRVVIFSNELLRFQDDSGALAGRFLTWRMQQSFRGKEDPDLTNKLLAECPGILNLALDALDRLRKRGRLEQCDSGAEMSERLGDLASDISGFVEECCVVGPEQEVLLDKLFSRWQGWCAVRNIRHGWGKPQFSEKLHSAVPTLRNSRPRKDNPGRLTTLIGIGLRKP